MHGWKNDYCSVFSCKTITKCFLCLKKKNTYKVKLFLSCHYTAGKTQPTILSNAKESTRDRPISRNSWQKTQSSKRLVWPNCQFNSRVSFAVRENSVSYNRWNPTPQERLHKWKRKQALVEILHSDLRNTDLKLAVYVPFHIRHVSE